MTTPNIIGARLLSHTPKRRPSHHKNGSISHDLDRPEYGRFAMLSVDACCPTPLFSRSLTPVPDAAPKGHDKRDIGFAAPSSSTRDASLK